MAKKIGTSFTITPEALKSLEFAPSRSDYVSVLVEHHDGRAKGAMDILRRRRWSTDDVLCLIDLTNGTTFTEATPPLIGLPLDMKDAEPSLLEKWGVNPDHWRTLTEGVDKEVADALMIAREEFRLGNPRISNPALTGREG